MNFDSKRAAALHRAGPNLRGEFVLYWMQLERRAEGNNAPNFSVDQAWIGHTFCRTYLSVIDALHRRRDAADGET